MLYMPLVVPHHCCRMKADYVITDECEITDKEELNIKKAFCILLSFMLMLSITACGGDDKPKETEKNDNGKPDTSVSTKPDTMAPEVSGEIYDTGELRALVPDGWAAFPIPDVFADEPDAVKTSCFHIIKDGTSDRDIHAKPYIRLERCEPDAQITDPDPAFYKNIEDVGPLDLGGHSWSGYVCEDCFGGYGKPVIGKMAVLWTGVGNVRYEAVIRLEFNGQKEKISLEDSDVQAILASVESSESGTLSE